MNMGIMETHTHIQNVCGARNIQLCSIYVFHYEAYENGMHVPHMCPRFVVVGKHRTHIA